MARVGRLLNGRSPQPSPPLSFFLARDALALAALSAAPVSSSFTLCEFGFFAAFCARSSRSTGDSMSLSRRQRQQMLAHCDQIHADDGVHPRDFFESPSTGSPTSRRVKRANRSAQQLCRQAWEALSLSLSADGRDPLLQEVQIHRVSPAPDASRLLVVVAMDDDRQLARRDEVLDRLREHAGRLRAELAASINRKRVPHLVFEVAAPSQGGAP